MCDCVSVSECVCGCVTFLSFLFCCYGHMPGTNKDDDDDDDNLERPNPM